MEGLIPKYEGTRQLLNQHHEKAVIFRHSHIAITDYHMGDNREFEKSLSIWDKIRWKYELLGGYYVKALKEFRVNRAFNVEQLKRFFPEYEFKVENCAYPYDDIDVELLTAPRDDIQRLTLTFMASEGKFKNNSKFTQQMIELNTGKGKAQPDDIIIPTPNGLVRFGNLKIGDYVYGSNMKPTKILEIYPQDGLKDVYTLEIQTEDGYRKVRCGIDHLWRIKLYYYYGPVQDLVLSLENIINIRKEQDNVIITIPYIKDNKISNGVLINIKKENYQCTQRCIKVEAEDHLYVTENNIITHNTYMGTAITAFLKSKILVIVPLAKLLNQWKESFINFIGMDEDEILIVKGSKICEQILEGKHTDKKVFIIMVDTIYSFAKRYGDIKTMDMLSATRCHTKIVDEVHLDLKAISMIEALSNFRMNYYMSASAGRSDGRENWIFKNLFTHIPRFGSNIETQEEKHLNVMVKKYYFTPTPKQIKRMVNNKTGLNTKAYETELRLSPEDQRLNFEQQLTVILNWTKKNLKEGNKIIVFGQSIEFLYYLQTIVEKVYPDRTSVYYGGMKKDEKEKALLSDIIIATTASLGTGADIKGLQFGINCSTYSSWISVKQISGRLRKLPDGTPTVYIEMVNFGYLKTVRQFEKRKPHLTKASRTGKLLMVN